MSDPNRVELEFEGKNYSVRIPRRIARRSPSFDALVSISNTRRLVIMGDKVKYLERTARNVPKSNVATEQISKFYMRYDDISEACDTSTNRDEHTMRGNYVFRKIFEMMGLAEETSRCKHVGKTTLKNTIQRGWRFLAV